MLMFHPGFQICICENNFLFLGSRLGNSLLLRFTEKENHQVITLDDAGEPPVKRNKPDSAPDNSNDSEKVLDSLNDCMASDVLDIRDPEELEVYGNEKQASLQITSYVFEVSYSIHYNIKLSMVITNLKEFKNRIVIYEVFCKPCKQSLY